MVTKLHDIINGIRQSVTEVEGKDKELRDDDFSITLKKKLPGINKAYEFKSYAPYAFKELRRICGISTESFLESWSLPSTSEAALSQSTGRSGSNFYKTPDHRYFFKTLLHAEVAAMINLLKRYLLHLRKYPRSFVMKAFGMYRIKHSVGEKLWIVIMGNVLPQPYVSIEEKYDLKGRVPKPGKSLNEREVRSRDALKDNEISRTFGFPKKHRKFYLKQLTKDVELLRDHNVMDYSLLVGIHYVTPKDEKRHHKNKKKLKRKINSIPVEKQSPFEFNCLKGFNPATGNPELYYIGIIDCLTNYVLFKHMANKLKAFRWERSMLSTVPADYYADRFLQFMTGRLLYDDPFPGNSDKRSTTDGRKRPVRTQSSDRLDSNRNRAVTTLVERKNRDMLSEGGSPVGHKRFGSSVVYKKSAMSDFGGSLPEFKQVKKRRFFDREKN
eukprot:TRINITY_DN10154_c0_g1_i1.p1 TRINITY_DN10154_c0_g1~~TRINITY_DN10154_c0_g1_i1.p1  ORF type:complete len:441 (-),score=79.06 TRINITY_DN10154_c0_g1_i1:23-1345(-)